MQYRTFPEGGVGVYQRLGAGDLDMTQWFVAPFVVEVDRGVPVVFVAVVHAGCFELFGTERGRAIRDLRGKIVAVPWLGPGPETFIATMLAYVGLDPRDVHFVVYPADESIQLLATGQIDAYLGFPPAPQELRGRTIGAVVVNSTLDRPWSQYFCCLAARHLVDKGVTKSYDSALQSMTDIPYGKWREYDPEDTVRFYALRIHEAGMIKTSPQKLIAQGTDWRFLNELKKELKG